MSTPPTAADWSARYVESHVPWDLGGPHPELVRRLAADPGLGRPDPGTAYVPGCGLGHDAVALAEAGWTVVGSDFAESVEATVADRLRPYGGSFRLGDALDVNESYDLWFDHTFFCAIPPSRRDELGKAAARSLRAGGRFIAIVFPVGREPVEAGPPHSMSTDDVDRALGQAFRLLVDERAAQPRGRRWPHRWATWERT